MQAARLKNVALFLASCFFSLFIFEVALRMYGFHYDPLQPFRGQREMILHPSSRPILKYELTPGASADVWGEHVAINSHGFRGPEPKAASSSRYRILILGDSIVFGYRLSYEATFIYKLQRLLDSAGNNFEVLNFGVSGYDTLQEVALLYHRGLSFQPDLVVLNYCLNDIGIVSVSKEFNQEQTLNQRYRRFKIVKGWENLPWFRLRLVQFVSKRLIAFKQQQWTEQRNDPEVFRREHQHYIETINDEETELLALMEEVSDVHPSPWYREKDRVGRVRFAFEWLKELSEKNGFRVLVTIIPWLDSEAEKYHHRAAHRIVELEARRVGFETLDFTDRFITVGMKDLRLHPRDLVHPNEDGHAIIAEELSEYITSNLQGESIRTKLTTADIR